MKRITHIGAMVLVFMGVAIRAPAEPVNAMLDGSVRQWVVLGPFPNPFAEKGEVDGYHTNGLFTDFLTDLGGESAATIAEGTQVTFSGSDGQPQTVRAMPATIKDNGYLDFRRLYGTGMGTAYAFCLVESQTEQTVCCGFGSNDTARIWVNGEMIHSAPYPPSNQRWTHEFPVHLKQGRNRVLVKVADWGGMAWECVMELYREDAPIVAQRKRAEVLRRFQECEIQPKLRWQFMFPPGKLPELEWDHPDIVEKAWGTFPLTVRWFNADFEEVTKADKPGRYAAVVDAVTSQGTHMRRGLTFYCHPSDWQPWDAKNRAWLEFGKGSPFDAAALKDRALLLEPILGDYLVRSLTMMPRGAVLAAGMAEMKPLARELSPMDSPLIINDEFHLALKRKVLGVSAVSYPPLALPKRLEGPPAIALHPGTLENAGVTAEGVDAIRRECQRWYEETKEPFAVLLARHGIVFLHEGFGMEKDRPTWTASITKALTGLMFAQFVDQGLISIDDPVGKFLPGFPTQGDKAVTLRHCFTHTSGLSGHGEWGGMHNPWLDSVVASGLEYLEPGTQWGYTGMGFELGGKVMEIVTGKSISRLFYEHFYEPLGIRTFYLEDLGGDARLNAEELGRVAQLLLNRGAYGDRQFFSPQTFELLKPQPLSHFYPGVDHQYGIGLCWRNVEPWMVEQFAVDKTKPILGKNVIGHDGASGSILRADFDNDLVLTQARDNPAADYDAHLIRFLETVSNALVE